MYVSKTIMFADDTTLYAIGKNSKELYEQVNEWSVHVPPNRLV